MHKAICILLFILEAVLLTFTIYQVILEGTSTQRALQSMLLLAAFAKTEYDFIQLCKPAAMEKKQSEE